MKKLLNISTHRGDIDLIHDDWNLAANLLREHDFDGYELYPVSGYDLQRVPAQIIAGLHLRFFIFLDAFWHAKTDALVDIFGNLDQARNYFGGLKREDMVDAYVSQLACGRQLGVDYAVFHAGQSNLKGLVDGRFSWSWRDTAEITAEIVRAIRAVDGNGPPIMFENLWWSGSLRFLDVREIEFLFQRLDQPDPGLVLDTGHLLNTNPDLKQEQEAISFLLRSVENLGTLRKQIKVVHLTRSLSGEYVRSSRKKEARPVFLDPKASFYERIIAAHAHVSAIDQHDPFEDSAICRLFDLIEPDHVVFEFSFRSLGEWRSKIQRQQKALGWS